MRYKLNDKRDRNRRLYLYHKAHPGMTLEAIGAVFHISGSMVCQIIKKRRS